MAITGNAGVLPSPLPASGTSIVYVGVGGIGDLRIDGDSDLSSDVGRIGNNPSSGAVTVSGTGSSWTTSGDLITGYSGTGALTIENGGSVTAVNNVIGYFSASASGTVIVRNAGSSLTSTYDTTVGWLGSATLTIEDGGHFTSSNRGAILASQIGASGAATVTGDDSLWSIGGTLVLGGPGTGVLTVTDNGAVTAAAVTIAQNGFGSGTLNLNRNGADQGVLETGSILKGSGTAVLNFNGGILRATANQSDVLQGFTSLAIGTHGAFFDSNGFGIGIGTAFTGTAGLTKLGAGTLTLSGSSSYSGTTSVDAGTLLVQGGAAIGDPSAVTALAGATLSLAANETIGSLAGGGNVVLGANTLTAGGNDGSTAFTGVITGTGSVVKDGAGTLTLGGANTYTGGTTVNAGALQVGDGGTTGAIGGDVTNDATLTFNRSDDIAFGDAITGTGALTKLGTGTLTLTDANSYAGGTTITAGTLRIGDGGTTGSISGDVTSTGTLAFDRSDSVAFTGDVSGTGGLTQMNAAGTLTLSGSSSYSGATAVDGGTLVLQDGGAVGDSSAVTVASGATLDVADDETIGSLAGAGAVTLGANALTAGGNDGSTNFSGTLAGTGGSLVKAGTGTLTLTGTSSHTGGTTISAGTLQVGNGGTTGAIGGDITNDATLTFNRSNDIAFGDAITGTGALTKLGVGTLTLTDSSSYTGGTTITAGTLQVGDGGTTGTIGGDVTNDATLTFNRSNDIAFGDAITGTGALTKLGTGTLTLTDASSYTGTTTITAGALRVDGSITSDVTVSSGATLGGSGEVGAVTVEGGGKLAAGNSPGVLATGHLTLTAGSTFEEEIGGTIPGSFDSIEVTGTVDLGDATFNGVLHGGFRPSTGASFTIIDNDGVDAVIGSFANLSEGERFAFAGRYFTISYQGGTGNDVTLTAVSPPSPPPPSAVAPTPNNDLLIGFGSVSGLAGNDTIDSGSGSDVVYGNLGDDVITVSAGQDTTFGGQGDDIVNAAAAAEPQQIFGNLGGDSLTGGLGADLIYGNQDNDLVYGNRGDDLLFGGQGNDTLFGGQGDDRLLGNKGDDLLVGGLGADLFVLGSADGEDLIADFRFEEGDRIDAGGRNWTVTDGAAGALVEFGGGNRVTLAGLAASQVSTAWFVTE